MCTDVAREKGEHEKWHVNRSGCMGELMGLRW